MEIMEQRAERNKSTKEESKEDKPKEEDIPNYSSFAALRRIEGFG